MPYNQIRLELDITGTNIDNRVINEPHTLSNRPSRAISPNLGPFFAESVRVMDGSVALDRGRDYQIVELHQEATLLYGKEISSVILILNQNVSSNVLITYQALGGHYSLSNEPIARLYEAVISDNRPVDWTNLLNKPTEFNPTIHRHLLDDVYGFEPIVDQLERIKRAITLGQSSIVLEIVNSLLGKFKCNELPKILPSNKLIQYDALLYFLSKRKILAPINIDTVDCMWIKGNSYYLVIDTTDYEPGVTLYWELHKPDTTHFNINNKSGYVISNGNKIYVSVYVPSENFISDGTFYAGVKRHIDDEDYIAVTYLISVTEHRSTVTGLDLHHFLYDDENWVDTAYISASANDELRLWHLLHT